MQIWQTYGHNVVKSILEKQLHTKKFPHAYLFVGPEGVGKKTLALEFSKKVLNTDNLKTHPDFQILGSTEEIGVKDMHEFIEKLSFKPFFGKKKISVINNSENLNLQSSNALLKTLEEPSLSSIIILIANSRKLLPTLFSRCQVFNFNSLSIKGLKQFAAEKNIAVSSEIFPVCFGRPAKLVEFMEREDQMKQVQDSINRFTEIRKQSKAERLLKIGELSKKSSEELKEIITFWHNWQNLELIKHPQNFRISSALLKAFKALTGNQNKKLILQDLFLSL